MTYYEKYQTLLDEVTIKVIKGTIPISFINEIKKSFEEWKSKTSVAMAANKEVKTVVHEFE